MLVDDSRKAFTKHLARSARSNALSYLPLSSRFCMDAARTAEGGCEFMIEFPSLVVPPSLAELLKGRDQTLALQLA